MVTMGTHPSSPWVPTSRPATLQGKATLNITLPELGERLEQVDEAQPLSGDQITELDRRLEELDADGPVGLTWDDLEDEFDVEDAFFAEMELLHRKLDDDDDTPIPF